MKKIVYLSGPVSLGGTSSSEETSAFVSVFAKVESLLASNGFDVINPCNCDDQNSWEDYMKIHIPSVCRADIVCALPAAERSRGAVLEIFLAHQLGIPVLSWPNILAYG